MSETYSSSQQEKTISVVFNCCRRPNLTELVLRRFIELMPEPYELIIVYDGNNASYINRIYQIKHPDIFLFNDGSTDRWALINKAYSMATGKLFMHLENDFYWVRKGTIERALNIFERYPQIQYIRFEFIPFHERQCTEIIPLEDDALCILRDPSEKPSTVFQFTLSPGIRKTKFPFGQDVFEQPNVKRQMEGFLTEKWNKLGYVSGVFTKENFRHIGIYDASGHYKTFYAERLTTKRGKRDIDPYREFCAICDNPLYRELYLRYLNDNGYKHD